MKLLPLAVLILLLLPGAFAWDTPDLPVNNVYDPVVGHNLPITSYTYDELSGFFSYASFKQWNDVARVCQTMGILYGHAPSACSQYGTTEMQAYTILSPRTARAYISFEVLPPPVIVVPARPVLLVDPVFPPWSPVMRPYW